MRHFLLSIRLGSAANRWPGLAMAGGLVFLLATIHATYLETPTVDEFAHLPVGAAYLSHGRMDLYSNNPPLIKYLISLPAVICGPRCRKST